MFQTVKNEDAKRLRAELSANPAFAALKEWAHEQRDLYLANLARSLFTNPDLVTEAALREKAAFFRGVNIVLNQPFFDGKLLKKELEQKDVTELA